MQNKRVNAMEHPAYNTMTLQEKLQMPEVRWAIAKAILATIAVCIASFCFAVVSVWVMLAVPIWYREYDELYADLWKEKVGCVADTKTLERVILECDRMHFDITPSLEKTFERTLSEFVLENPHSKYVLVDLFRCHNAGKCKTIMLGAIDLFIQSRIWVLIVSWIPTLFGVLVMIQRFMAPYWNKVWHQLTRESVAEVKWGSMKKEEQDQVLRDIVSPPPPPIFPSAIAQPEQWVTPTHLDRAALDTTSEDDEVSSSASRNSYCMDEAKSFRPIPRNRARKPPPRLTESNSFGGRADDMN